MEMVKNVAAVIGLILSTISLCAAISKSFRAQISKVITHYSGKDETLELIGELKEMMEDHIEKDLAYHESMNEKVAKLAEANYLNEEFTRMHCRTIIKDIFYKYKDEKVLPLYEWKTLNKVKELYLEQLHGNSFAKLLLNEMDKWEVDYSDEKDLDD